MTKTEKTPQYGASAMHFWSFDGSVITGSKLPDARPSNLHLSGRPYFGENNALCAKKQTCPIEKLVSGFKFQARG